MVLICCCVGKKGKMAVQGTGAKAWLSPTITDNMPNATIIKRRSSHKAAQATRGVMHLTDKAFATELEFWHFKIFNNFST